MKLTKDEQRICDNFRKRYQGSIMIGEEMVDVQKVRCSECPLVIYREQMLCKANISKNEWKELCDGK